MAVYHLPKIQDKLTTWFEQRLAWKFLFCQLMTFWSRCWDKEIIIIFIWWVIEHHFGKIWECRLLILVLHVVPCLQHKFLNTLSYLLSTGFIAYIAFRFWWVQVLLILVAWPCRALFLVKYWYTLDTSVFFFSLLLLFLIRNFFFKLYVFISQGPYGYQPCSWIG